MAGTIVHLLTAMLLYEEIDKRQGRYVFDSAYKPEKRYFVAGNICPDGIMARTNYERSMKLHTHFRDGIPDGSFDKEGMVSLFERRMQAFWKEHIEDEKEKPGLYLGYVTHMMTDEAFILKERPRFFERIAAIGLTQKDVETFIRFNKETDQVDFRLINENPILQEAYQILEQIEPYEIKGMITKDELTQSRQWILEHFFQEGHEVEETRYLWYRDMMQFVEKMKEQIMERLFTEEYLVFSNS